MKKTLLAAVVLLAAVPALAQTSSTSGGTTTTTTTTTTKETTFTPAQETIIRKSVKAKPVTVKEKVVVGGAVPSDIELQEIPSDVVTEVPSVRSYRYFSTDAGLAIVDPSTRKVVRVISE